MSNAKPPGNLSPALCQRLSDEMLKACQDVAARHGVMVGAKGIAAVDLRWGFDPAFRVSIPLPDGTAFDPERLRFEALAEAFGLSAEDYGRQFSTGRETFRLIGIDPRRPKYPISAEPVPDGQGVKFTADRVVLSLQKGMRDVTPQRRRQRREWPVSADCRPKPPSCRSELGQQESLRFMRRSHPSTTDRCARMEERRRLSNLKETPSPSSRPGFFSLCSRDSGYQKRGGHQATT